VTTPHLAAVLARTQGSLLTASKSERDQLSTSVRAELAALEQRLLNARDGNVYTELMRQKGRLQAAAVSLSEAR
jgi:hypothetical protein